MKWNSVLYTQIQKEKKRNTYTLKYNPAWNKRYTI